MPPSSAYIRMEKPFTSPTRKVGSFLVAFSSVGMEITFNLSILRFIEDDTALNGENRARIWSNQVQIYKSRIRSGGFQRDKGYI